MDNSKKKIDALSEIPDDKELYFVDDLYEELDYMYIEYKKYMNQNDADEKRKLEKKNEDLVKSISTMKDEQREKFKAQLCASPKFFYEAILLMDGIDDETKTACEKIKKEQDEVNRFLDGLHRRRIKYIFRLLHEGGVRRFSVNRKIVIHWENLHDSIRANKNVLREIFPCNDEEISSLPDVYSSDTKKLVLNLLNSLLKTHLKTEIVQRTKDCYKLVEVMDNVTDDPFCSSNPPAELSDAELEQLVRANSRMLNLPESEAASERTIYDAQIPSLEDVLSTVADKT